MSLQFTATQKTNLKIGSFIGFTSFLLMLVDYFAFRNSTSTTGYIEGNGAILALITGIILGIRNRRNTNPNSLLTFGQGLSTGINIALWTGLVYSALSYSYIVFLNPNYVDEMLLKQTYRLSHDATAAESVGARLIAEMTFKPLTQLVGKVLGSLFFGFIVSTICAWAFQRKQKLPSM